MSDIRAIETEYRGRRFRSRLEARWAVFFDHIGIRWHYEPEGFDLPSRRYLPDFYLPDVTLRGNGEPGLWVEVKPDRGVDGPDDHLWELARLGKPVALVCGPPTNVWGDLPNDAHYQYAHDGGDWWDNSMRFFRCHDCGTVKYEFDESNYTVCPKCSHRCDDKGAAMEDAFRAALSARFEYGEQG